MAHVFIKAPRTQSISSIHLFINLFMAHSKVSTHTEQWPEKKCPTYRPVISYAHVGLPVSYMSICLFPTQLQKITLDREFHMKTICNCSVICTSRFSSYFYGAWIRNSDQLFETNTGVCETIYANGSSSCYNIYVRWSMWQLPFPWKYAYLV